jgi:Ca2+-binding RTX toxin-like protein
LTGLTIAYIFLKYRDSLGAAQMGTLTAYDGLGRGLDMSGDQGGVGYVISNPTGADYSVSFFSVVNDTTVSYTVNGLDGVAYLNLVGVVDLSSNDILIYDFEYMDADFTTVTTWQSANIYANLTDDFSTGAYYTSFLDGDSIVGNSYGDTIQSGENSDTIFGGLGNDLISGGNGADLIYGNKDLDTVFGGAGNDTLFGGQNSLGESTNEGTIYREGIEYLYGDSGDDVIYGNYGSDNLFGGTGNDKLYGGQDNDTLAGNSGNDTLFGNRGDDLMIGGDGADTFMLTGSGANKVSDFTGAGGDRIDAADPTSVEVTQTGDGYALLTVSDDLSIELVGVNIGDFQSGWIV